MIETNLPDDTISIPAFREEGDLLRSLALLPDEDFNPRLP